MQEAAEREEKNSSSAWIKEIRIRKRSK